MSRSTRDRSVFHSTPKLSSQDMAQHAAEEALVKQLRRINDIFTTKRLPLETVRRLADGIDAALPVKRRRPQPHHRDAPTLPLLAATRAARGIEEERRLRTGKGFATKNRHGFATCMQPKRSAPCWRRGAAARGALDL